MSKNQKEPANDGIGLNWPEGKLKGKELKEHRKERQERGYSTADWWSFDTFIAGVIGQAVADFRDKGIGYPGDMTEESFAAFCTEISEPLLRYADNKFRVFNNEQEQKMYDDAVEAMKKFSERLGCWWD